MTGSINAFDLNLLRVFDALYEERSVQRAAQRIGLSQSAVSHSLARLRHALEDELFVRTGSGMMPTARAFAVAGPIREALVRVESVIGPARFDPVLASDRFIVAANDFITQVLFPSLIEMIEDQAPRVDLVVRPGTRLDLAEQIDLGRIDVALGSFSHIPARLKSQVLFRYDDVLLTGSTHALVGQTVTAQALAETPLMVVSLGGAEDGAVQGFILERGLARRSEMFDRPALEKSLSESSARLALVLPHFLAMPGLLAHSKLAAILPRPLARHMTQGGGFAIHELPYASTSTQVQLVWHERTDDDAARRWLRTMLARAADAAALR